MLKKTLLLILILITISCDEDDFAVDNITEDDSIIPNNPPSVFDVFATNISDSSALIYWEKSIDPDSNQIEYFVLFQEDTLWNSTDTSYYLNQVLTPSTNYEILVGAHDSDTSILSMVEFTTTSLTFVKRFEAGTETEIVLETEDYFVVGRVNWQNISDVFREIMILDKEGNVISVTGLPNRFGSNTRHFESIFESEDKFIAIMSEWDQYGGADNLNIIEFDIAGAILNEFDFRGNNSSHSWVVDARNSGSKPYSFQSINNNSRTYLGSEFPRNLISVDTQNGTRTLIDSLTDNEIINDFLLNEDNSSYTLMTRSAKGGFDGLNYYSSTQELVWSKEITLSNEYLPKKIFSKDGNLFVLGASIIYPFNILGLVVKLDHDGNVIWESVIDEGGYETFTTAMNFTTDQGVVIGAEIRRSQGSDMGIIKLNSNGEIDWSKKFRFYDDLEINVVKYISESPDGGYFIHGSVIDYYNTSTERYQFFANVNNKGEL